MTIRAMKMSAVRKGLLAAWLALPIGVFAYHEGPGQDAMKLDDADVALARAAEQVAAGSWLDAVDSYDEALGLLPEDRIAEARRIRLERSKAAMNDQGLVDAHADFRDLVAELNADADADPVLLADAREAFANSQYYMTWLMRLEGRSRDEWEPEIDAARQTYRLLAELADQRGDAAASTRHREDLEAAIRLARMEVRDLQGLPLPSQ